MGQLINLGKEVMVKTPKGNNYSYLKDLSAYTSLTEILNINGGGFLQSAVNFNNSGAAKYLQLQITVDSVVILNLDNTTTELDNAKAQGIINDLVNYGSSGYLLLPFYATGNANVYLSTVAASGLNFGSSISQSCSADGGLFLIKNPIRFETSLSIKVKKESSGMPTICEYYLDD